MKFFIINTDYKKFLWEDAEKNPAVYTKSFKDQLEHRYDSLFGMSNFYSKNLKLLGHEAIDIIANHQSIQKQWAVENSISWKKSRFQTIPFFRRYFKEDWMETILEAQIAQFNPDIIYNMAMEMIGSKFFNRIKTKNKNIKIIGQHAAPLAPLMTDLSSYDLILSSLPNFVSCFNKIGVHSEYFRLGFEDQLILPALKSRPIKNDVVFIGSIGDHHSKGTSILEYVAKMIPQFKIWGSGIENMDSSSPLREKYQGKPLFGKEMYEEVYNSKIVINRHIDIAENYANNMRLYESTGVGAFLITDKKTNLSDIFEIGKEVETYNSEQELIEKIEFYLNNESARIKIAVAGQARTLKDHTYRKRMRELLEIIDKRWKIF